MSETEGKYTGRWIVTAVIGYICAALLFGLFYLRADIGGLFWLASILVGGLIVLLLGVLLIVWIMGEDAFSFDHAPGE